MGSVGLYLVLEQRRLVDKGDGLEDTDLVGNLQGNQRQALLQVGDTTGLGR